MSGGDVIDAVLPVVDEGALWQAWRGLGDERARASLLALHLPYARVVAATYYGRRLHDEIEFGDYHQLACMALIEAANRYDPARGVMFRSFAARRMHGAILDGIEQMTEKQQQIAARQRLQASRRDDVRAWAQERADGPGDASGKVLRLVAEAGLAFALGWLLEGTGMVQSAEEDARAAPFYASSEIRQLRERIAGIVASLPPQERRVVHAHYYQQRPFEEIAAEMALTRGRISQIHRQALTRLRGALAPLGALGAF